MSGTGYVIGPQIPQGLAVIVEGLAREVLRHQPTDIYAFAAHHFEQLMKLREKGGDVEVIPQVFDLIEKTAPITPIPTCKVARKQREATNGGCGWSINRTVKVFKKHELNRDVKNKEAEKKIADDYSVTRSAGSRKETRSICGQLVRSSSVGDLQFRKDVGRPFDEYNVSKRYARNMDNKHEKRLERQKSTGEIEGTRRSVIIITGERTRSNRNGGIDRNRSRSVVNDRSKWYESDVGERTRWQGGRTDNGGGTIRGYRNGRDRGGSKSASNEQRGRKKLDGNFRNKQDMKINRLKLRSGESEGDSKGSGVQEREGENDRERMLITEMIDWESLNDSSRAKSFDVANMTNKTDGSWLCNEEDIVISTVRKNRSEDNLIVFPSVGTRQCSSRCLTNEKHHELDEPFSRSDFILPPISSDSSKSIKRSADLTLPFLSNGRATNTFACSGGSPRDPNNYCNAHNNTLLQLKSTNSFDHEPTSVTQYELTCSTSNDEIANDCKRELDNLIVNDIVCWNDSRLTSGRDESENEKENGNGNGNGNDNEKGKVRKDDHKDGAIVLPTSMIIEQRIFGSKEISQQVENTGCSDSRETDIEEVFKDSLNVTPDSIECSQRSDSFDEETEEQRNRSNELKQKLIEIETVERNIENTLISSGTTTIPFNFNNVVEETTLVKCQVDSDVEACKCTRENDAILAIDTSNETSGEKESTGENQQPSKVRRNDVPEMFNRRNSNVLSKTHGPIAKDDDVDAIPVSERSLPAKSLITIDDPSCYVLTEGSPCEIPDSVTTVIIPDRNVLRDDEMVELEKEKMVREALSMRRASHWDSDSDSDSDADTWKRPTEEFQRYNEDPVFFGDRVSPRAFHCPTSIKLHFLRGMTDTVDRTIASHHERQQKQQQQQQQQQLLGNINEEAESDHAVDDHASCIELSETARGKNRDVVSISCKDNETSCVVDENIDKYLKKDESRTRDDRLDYFCRSLDEDRPYVPELNLDSLRDVTISSFGISDSTENLEDRWKREERNEQEETDDIHFHEGENTLSSFDTFISEEKMTLDDGSTMALSSSKSEFLPEERSINREDERSKIVVINNETDNNYDVESKEDRNSGRPVCSARGGNSLNIEEEIAKELIGNLILETPEVQERITDTGNVFELTTKSNDNDEMEGEEQKQEKEEEGKGDDGGDDEVKKEEHEDKENIDKHYSSMTSQRISDHENNPSYPSSFVFLESADPSIIELDNVFKQEKDVIEKLSTDLYTQKEKFEATTRRIQSCEYRSGSNISALGCRQLLQVDERQDQNDSPQATPTLNEQVEKKSTEWPMIGNRNRSDLWHTGEFHDSLPLPIFHISNIISTKDVHASNIIQKKMLPASTRTTTATTTTTAMTAMATITTTAATATATTTATDSWFTVDPSYIAYEALTANPNTKICLVSKSATPRTTVVYTTGFTKDLGSLETKQLLMNSLGNSNFLPSIVRAERIVDDTNCAILVRSAVDTLDSDIDDLREPLALDDGEPKPSVVIEEILVEGMKEENERWKKEEEEEEEQTLSYSCEMKNEFVL